MKVQSADLLEKCEQSVIFFHPMWQVWVLLVVDVVLLYFLQCIFQHAVVTTRIKIFCHVS